MTEHEVDAYTGQYDDAICPAVAIEDGDTVRTTADPDAREWDAFRRRLSDAGLAIEFDEYDEATGEDIYDVVAA